MLQVKESIRRTSLNDARALAQHALELGSVAEAQALLGGNEREPVTPSPTPSRTSPDRSMEGELK
jgi:hypothetical protein